MIRPQCKSIVNLMVATLTASSKAAARRNAVGESTSRCDPANQPRRVRMAFVLVNDRWRCTFTDETQGVPLPRSF
ncbi:hypothetical protein, partial [Granulicella aggregans]|uniref:hypothetical protein n=1 Tax=Granulicella aggregans TaxID=474949 RepID=UPI001C85127B